MILSNQVIAEISRLLQVALLTGTDVVDNLRLLEIKEDSEEGMLVLTDAYVERSSRNIEKMIEDAEKLGKNNG
tara:strand:+ start:716 stop:934 length:219 start_codon:yes stop_codon:yes gene_type:complete